MPSMVISRTRSSPSSSSLSSAPKSSSASTTCIRVSLRAPRWSRVASPDVASERGSRLRAVVFDWGGTLTPFHDIDLADLWSAAARILAPEREAELTGALLAVERESWARVTRERGLASGTLDDLLALAAERTGVTIEPAVRDRALEASLAA